MAKQITTKGGKSDRRDIEAFLDQVERLPAKQPGGRQGKLVFAVDATASRQPTWDMACQIQSSMFSATAKLGGIQTQLCYYRGFHEMYASPWLSDTVKLRELMGRVQCLGGQTQIGRVLQHILNETRKTPVHAGIFIGDAVEESADSLCNLAGQLGILNVPLFIFQEGNDPHVRGVFQQLAKLSGGAHCSFNRASADTLAALLGAVAVYASGGAEALEHYSRNQPAEVKRLSHQMNKPKAT